jgi:hypothetical protein
VAKKTSNLAHITRLLKDVRHLNLKSRQSSSFNNRRLSHYFINNFSRINLLSPTQLAPAYFSFRYLPLTPLICSLPSAHPL